MRTVKNKGASASGAGASGADQYKLGYSMGVQSGYQAGEQAASQRIEEQRQLIHKAIDVLERHYAGRSIPPDIRALLSDLEAYS